MADRKDWDADECWPGHVCRFRCDPASLGEEGCGTLRCNICSEVAEVAAMTTEQAQAELRSMGLRPPKRLPRRLRRALADAPRAGYLASVTSALAPAKEFFNSLFFFSYPSFVTKWPARLLPVICVLIWSPLLFQLIGLLNKTKPAESPVTRARSNRKVSTRHQASGESNYSIRPAALSDADLVTSGTISDRAYLLLHERAAANRNNFFVYRDADSAFNHGFPSGLFGTIDLQKVVLDSNCVDDPASQNGCSTDPARLDKTRGTVFRFNFPALTGSDFVGLNWQEPEDFNGRPSFGSGYDLTPATDVRLDARSPDGAKVQFGVGGCVSNFYQLGPAWTTINISIADLIPPPGPSNAQCPVDLTNTHILFTVATNASPNGGTVLLDNIQFLPVPARQNTDPKALSLPLGNQTFGSVLQKDVTPDQANRNLAPIYEAAATTLALLRRGRPEDVARAIRIADALDYALHHDNHGNLLPSAPDGSVGLRSAYQGGDIALLNGQSGSGAQAGDVRLAGFSIKDGSCGPGGFCLVLDGATGGNNAWAMLALQAAYLQSGDVKYLNDAETIGRWIVGTLKDPATPATNPPGYGGYFVGFADGGNHFPIKGKSTENNGDIFVAFSLVAQVESNRGNTASAAQWQSWANVAGDFVMQMFDPAAGRFYAGTVTVDPPSPENPPRGNCQSPLIRKGNDIINTCDFLDSNTFTALPMAASPRYHDQIDWRHPTQYVIDHFAQTVTAGGHTYSGFDIVSSPSTGPNGIAWEFTGQAVVTARFIDALYNQSAFEGTAASILSRIEQAQESAPFGDGLGLPAGTLQDGDTLPPLKQCLDTPFQCIPERVGLAATNWAIYADSGFNPLWFGSLSFSQFNPPFPQQLVGTTSPPSKITVTNSATAPVTFSGISIGGPNAGDFSTSDDCHSTPLTAGATCTITVTFTPSSAGDRTATLLIKDDALGGPHSITLVGTGLPLDDFALHLSPEPQSVVAGGQATYTVQTQLTRGSAQPLTLSVSCPALSCSLNTTNINTGGSAALTVSTSLATPPGSYAVTITATDTEVTHTAVTNLGVTPGAGLSPTSLTFATQHTGTTSAPQTVTLKNNSASALSVRDISIGGPFGADFAETNNCGSSLAAGASCLISVTFKPTGVEGRRATLFVLDGAGGSPQTAGLRGTGAGSCSTIADCGFPFLNERASENQNSFFVYRDADSGFNHGFPSGLFGSPGFDLDQVKIDAACVDDPLSANGCATDVNSFDAARGTAFRVTFPPQAFGQFVGLNFQDPQDYDPDKKPGNGYDLSPATAVQLDARSPDAMKVQFGVGGCVSDVITLSPSWRTLTIPLNTLHQPPDSTNKCPPDITNTHLLFTVVTNVSNAPAGGTVLLDNVQFTPAPARQKNDPEVLSFPVATQTYGVVANLRLPIPPDQVDRNLAPISSSAQTALALLQRRQPDDVENALRIVNAFHYALYHDNHGDPIPSAPQATDGCYSGVAAQRCGLHSAYITGDLAFLNDQPAPALGRAGDVRLAGFSSGTALCGPSGFCLVLDGANGGDNAWAILALVAAYEQSGDVKHLDDANVIGNWIIANLADGGGYGGYFVGYNDGGLPKQLIRGKSTVHNAQIFAAFSRLAQAEAARGNSAAAALWTTRADAAAKFVLRMFDKTVGRFYAGAVNVAGAATQAPGLCPDTSKQNGSDVVNACDSLDSNAVATLALASRYPTALDWTRPVQYALDHFAQTATAGGKSFGGFDLIPPQGAERVGVAWEYTGQVVLSMNFVGAAKFVNPANSYLSEIRQAQVSAPFGDGLGIVGSTLQDGDALPPYSQCMKTPFACIPERATLASTAWGLFADLKANPLQSSPVTSVFEFDSSLYSVEEGCTAVNVRVLRTGLTSEPASVDIAGQDGTAEQKSDYTAVVGRLAFAAGETEKTFQVLVSDDAYAEGTETATLILQNPSNGTLGDPSTATLQITDNVPEPPDNPIDVSRTFVGQHYHDFLHRQSDQSGENFWTQNIESCGANAQCRQVKRVQVSAAFFLSIEFKETGFLVIRAHKAAFGNAASTPRYTAFLADQHEVGEGFFVGQGDWQQRLEANKRSYLQEFTSRPEFVSRFPQGVSAADYVSRLFANAGATPTQVETADAVSKYGAGDAVGRASALRSVVESGSVFNAEYNSAFVLMQYYGYLRRDPDSAPDIDFSGYGFWLAKLNSVSRPGEDMRDDAQAQARVQRAEMVRAFIESIEYRGRFGGAAGENR